MGGGWGGGGGGRELILIRSRDDTKTCMSVFGGRVGGEHITLFKANSLQNRTKIRIVSAEPEILYFCNTEAI